MTHKNWDNVRDYRLYSYLNQHEMDEFFEAMRLQDMDQKSTAARTFILERSKQIIIENKQNQFRQAHITLPSVKYQFPTGDITVTNFLT